MASIACRRAVFDSARQKILEVWFYRQDGRKPVSPYTCSMSSPFTFTHRPVMTTSTLTIRSAAPEDLRAILGMIEELAAFEKLSHLLVATEATLHDGLFGPQRSCEALVGVENGEVVCYALFFHNYSTFLARKGIYLEDLYVRQTHRAKGYGKQLMIAVAQLAVERGCGRFEWSVLDWNETAINFYQGMGADVMPDWRICRVAGSALHALAAAG